jgi:hypothetical protein
LAHDAFRTPAAGTPLRAGEHRQKISVALQSDSLRDGADLPNSAVNLIQIKNWNSIDYRLSNDLNTADCLH